MEAKKMGLFIKELRREHDLTQEQLAEALFVSGKTVSRWETGNSLPDLMMLQNIADYFGVEIRELIDGERLPEQQPDEKTVSEKETVRKMSEYSSIKEKRGSRNLWIGFGLVLLAAGLITGLVLLKQRSDELDRRQTMSVTGKVTQYTKLSDGRAELYLLCENIRIVRLQITPNTEIVGEALSEQLLNRQNELILSACCVYTKREEEAARKRNEVYAYPATLLAYADQQQDYPGQKETEPGKASENPGQESLKPLAELREGYTSVQAESDGCVVMWGTTLQHGQQRWDDFLRQTREGKAALIRIYQYYSEERGRKGFYQLKELDYDGNSYRLTYYDQTGETGGWILRQDSYTCLNEEIVTNFDYRVRGFLLADDPTADYSGYTGRFVASSPITYNADPKYDHCSIVLTWNVSDDPSARNPLYGIAFADIDGDGAEEKCFLEHGTASGVFSFSLEIYGRTSGLIWSNTFVTPFMELRLIRQELGGELFVEGITSQADEPETHLYSIMIRDGVLSLEENGNALPSFY